MPRIIDLNADLGEGVTDDEGLLAVVTSANVACGYHAGDRETMLRVCEEASRRGVAVGAQVSYDDRANFGRVSVDVAYEVLRDQVADQVQVLSAIAVSVGTTVSYVKPHGALYHRTGHDEEHAAAVLDGSGGLPVLGLPGSRFLDLAGTAGRLCFHEGFPDRAYTAAGTLVARSEPGAVLEDPAEIARRGVELARAVHSVCVHGDSPGAVDNARAVRGALEAAGFELRRFV
ncbi:MAG: LamB/YcsF family protein [Nocardioidaceae bacterium]